MRSFVMGCGHAAVALPMLKADCQRSRMRMRYLPLLHPPSVVGFRDGRPFAMGCRHAAVSPPMSKAGCRRHAQEIRCAPQLCLCIFVLCSLQTPFVFCDELWTCSGLTACAEGCRGRYTQELEPQVVLFSFFIFAYFVVFRRLAASCYRVSTCSNFTACLDDYRRSCRRAWCVSHLIISLRIDYFAEAFRVQLAFAK